MSERISTICSAHVLGCIEVPPAGRVCVRDRGGDDAQRAPVRVTQDGCRRPTFRGRLRRVAGQARADPARAASATSSSGSNTNRASRHTSRLRRSRGSSVPSRRSTWALVRTYPGATPRTRCPVDSRPQVPARTRTVLASATRRDRQRLRIVRPLHGRSREWLEPDEHLRQPLTPSRSRPSRNASSSGGGSVSFSVRTTVDVWGRLGRGVASARSRTGRPPATGSSSAWTPAIKPAAQSVNAAEVHYFLEPRSQPASDRMSRWTRR